MLKLNAIVQADTRPRYEPYKEKGAHSEHKEKVQQSGNTGAQTDKTSFLVTGSAPATTP